MSPAPLREESVRTSLQDLQRLEDDRLEKERDRAVKRDAQSALDRATRARAEERAAREEEARLAAMKDAIVERARIESLARADAERGERLARERREEREEAERRARLDAFARVPQTKDLEEAAREGASEKASSGAWPVIIGGLFGIVLATMGAFTYYGAVVMPKTRAERDLLQHAYDEAFRDRAEDHSARVALEDKVANKDAELNALRHENARLMDEAQNQKASPIQPQNRHFLPVHPPEKKTTCAYEHDPLCSDL